MDGLAFFVTKKGRRLYAVHRPQTLSERIAAQSNVQGNWEEIMRARSGSREIRNFKRV